MAPNRTKPSEKRTKPGRIQTVLTTLGREIAQEVIPAGAALPPEPSLESRFGVGRGVIREAIKILAGKGLVSVRPRHGTHVLPRRDWSLSIGTSSGGWSEQMNRTPTFFSLSRKFA